jgi:hypothetical protein
MRDERVCQAVCVHACAICVSVVLCCTALNCIALCRASPEGRMGTGGTGTDHMMSESGLKVG